MYTCHVLKDVDEFLTEQGWDFNNMENLVPMYVVEHIRNTLSQYKLINQGDKPWWNVKSTGNFIVKSVWGC